MEQKFVLPSDCFVWRKGEDILVYNAATKAHVEAKVTDARIGEFCDHMDDLSKLNTDILDEADQAKAGCAPGMPGCSPSPQGHLSTTMWKGCSRKGPAPLKL